MSLSDYETMTEEYAQRLDDAYAALARDADAVYAYNMTIQLTLLIVSLSFLLGYVVMEFTVPMVLQNGQTLGKKIFGIALMRTDSVRISGITLFVRTILGKYTVETMVPVLLLLMIVLGNVGLAGTLALVALLIVQLALVIATRTHSPLHDLLASTVCVDMESQRIFDTREAMIAFKERAHAEQVAHQPY